MDPIQSVDELAKRNVSIIAEMERAASGIRTRGERIADRIASAVGSWPFIIGQTIILGAWIVLNLLAWIEHWDPYPFILLNLALSFQSAYAAPILMISQNRQAKLSERRNHLDLQINMLAEQESAEILRLLKRLCEHTGLKLDEGGGGEGTEEDGRSGLVKQLQGEIEAQIEQVAEALDAGVEAAAAVSAAAAVVVVEGVPPESARAADPGGEAVAAAADALAEAAGRRAAG
ncbi:hypothetical protein OJF2_66410 [Aquisphaera giovannonii]|uniref:DUF1003 domain-containing protein n=1 Tax=Aquisphaera giovannonii TaxID=406548 RepID=A0A5B9WDA6_9BACT|nr:DUF1003 domain-containing protein [Aquisphaera giovannonii]QEH38045.1 hypothetical protein OJF2_66410 [Aquisphaera giovannonii]